MLHDHHDGRRRGDSWVRIRHAVFGMVYQVVTEQQPFPERAANLAEVDMLRTTGAERGHTLYQELTLCVWVVFPVDVPDALQRLHDCGPMLVSRANQDIDDRFCGYTRKGSTTKM